MPEAPAAAKPAAGKRRFFEVFFNILGLGIFAFLIVHVGIREIKDQILRFGWWFFAICLLQMGWFCFQAAAWRIVQNNLSTQVSFLFLLRVKIIGEALNTMLPMANLGGDAARAYLIQHRVPMREGLAGVLVDKTFEFIGGILSMVAGLIAALTLPRLPDGFTPPAVVCLVVLVVGITLFILLQIKGFYSPLLHTVGRFRAVRRFLEQREEEFRTLDQNLRRFYTAGMGGMLLVSLLHLIPRALGAMEVMVIAHVLGAPINFLEALFVATAVTISNTIFFLFPGEWGVSEGMHLLAMSSLGLSNSVGFTMGIIRRIRRLIFVGIGMVFYRFGRRRQATALAEEQS